MEHPSVYESKNGLRSQERVVTLAVWLSGVMAVLLECLKIRRKEALAIIRIIILLYIHLCMSTYTWRMCGGHRIRDCVCPQTPSIFSIFSF